MIPKVLIATIRIYQQASFLLAIRCCRFYPSCSQYAIDAVSKHGVTRGTAMAFNRILRCSPLSQGGFDPVR